MAHQDNLSIGVFIDGGYFAKIDEVLRQKSMGKVNVKGLLQFIPEMIGKQFGIDRKLLYITESHYYRGRFRASEAEDRHLLLSEEVCTHIDIMRLYSQDSSILKRITQ